MAAVLLSQWNAPLSARAAPVWWDGLPAEPFSLQDGGSGLGWSASQGSRESLTPPHCQTMCIVGHASQLAGLLAGPLEPGVAIEWRANGVTRFGAVMGSAVSGVGREISHWWHRSAMVPSPVLQLRNGAADWDRWCWMQGSPHVGRGALRCLSAVQVPWTLFQWAPSSPSGR